MTMRQQAPQPAEGRRGDGNPELGDIPFQKGADEALAPLITGRLAPGEQTAGEAAAYPQRDEGHRRGRCDFGGEQGRQFQEHNTPGQRLRRLAQERIRGRAQQEKLAGTASLVNHAAQDRKEVGHALHLIQTEERRRTLAPMHTEEEFRIGQAPEVRGAFQIQQDRLGPLPHRGADECRFATLPRPDECDGGEVLQRLFKAVLHLAWNITLHIASISCNLQGYNGKVVRQESREMLQIPDSIGLSGKMPNH